MDKITELTPVFRLVRDNYNMWIEEKTVSAKTGKDSWTRCSGYYHTYEGLAESFCNRRFRNVDAANAKELVTEIAKASKEAKALCKKLMEVKKGTGK